MAQGSDVRLEVMAGGKDRSRTTGLVFGTAQVNLTAQATARDYPEIEITCELDGGDPDASGEDVPEGNLRSS